MLQPQLINLALDKDLFSVFTAELLQCSVMEATVLDDAFPLSTDLMNPDCFPQIDLHQTSLNTEQWKIGLVYLQTGGKYSLPQLCSILSRCRRWLLLVHVSTTTFMRFGLTCTIPALADSEDHMLVESITRNDGLGAMFHLQVSVAPWLPKQS